jgi:hypothetical protein
VPIKEEPKAAFRISYRGLVLKISKLGAYFQPSGPWFAPSLYQFIKKLSQLKDGNTIFIIYRNRVFLLHGENKLGTNIGRKALKYKGFSADRSVLTVIQMLRRC